MSNPIISGVYAYRNGEKVLNGDTGRLLVVGGQAKNALMAASKLDGMIGKGASVAVDAMSALSNSNSIFKEASKFINWSSQHINPLLTVAAGVRVVKSDDKKSALIKEGLSMSTMFLGEEVTKNLINKSGIKKLRENSKNKVVKFGLLAVEAAIQIFASIKSYDFGAKIAEKINKK